MTFDITLNHIFRIADEYEDMRKLMAVGEMMIPFIRGELSILEEYKKNNYLDWLYKGTEGTIDFNAYAGGIVKQIAHRFPYMNILEIGKPIPPQKI